GYNLKEIAEYIDIDYATVSRVVKKIKYCFKGELGLTFKTVSDPLII
ncbi:unnamed protein product, partial [marine sediment metagenome]